VTIPLTVPSDWDTTTTALARVAFMIMATSSTGDVENAWYATPSLPASVHVSGVSMFVERRFV